MESDSDEDALSPPSKEEVDQWTGDLNLLLKDNKGYEHLDHFLRTCKFLDSQKALKFWKKCSDTLELYPSDGSSPDADVSVENIRDKAKDLLNYAQKHVSSLLEEETNALRDVEQNPDDQKMRAAVEIAMAAAANRLLTPVYNEFKVYLVDKFKPKRKRRKRFRCIIS